MKPEENVECTDVEKVQHHAKNTVKQHSKKNIQDLSKEEAKMAEEAKQGALEILQDALKKKDKVLMQVPERVVLQGEEREPFWMQRHAILTEDTVRNLLAELRKVRFKKNTSKIFCAAYVMNPSGKGRTIYLCDYFWKSQKYLENFSQPGILIHEVSHFLGAKDITYEENTLCLGCKGSFIKSNPSHGSTPSEEDDWEKALKKALMNANNIAHEFELTINHRGHYVDGRYSCCGETKRYSVCESSVPDHFHTCDPGDMWETEILLKELDRRSKTISPKLSRIHRIVDEMDTCFRDAKMGVSIAFAGGATAALTGILGVFLAPVTGGLSALWPGLFSVAGLGLAVAAGSSFQMFTEAAKKEVYAICDEYQRFRDIQRLITILNGTKCLKDSRFYVLLDAISKEKNRREMMTGKCLHSTDLAPKK